MKNPMILVQLNTWSGPSRDVIRRGTEERGKLTLETYASRLSIPEAIAAVAEYERYFNTRYGDVRAINHNLIGIQVLPCDLSDEELDSVHCITIEQRLAASKADWEAESQ